MPAGSWITIRVNQPLSSEHNQPGDAFTGTLSQPLVVSGRVVARPGQTIAGRVADVEKAGHVKGVSQLSLEVTEISLVDGQQIPVKTQLIARKGGTSVGSDVGAIGATTAVGAAVGAAVDGGFGAGMGAIGGAVVSTIGVLSTRGRATVVYPETLLTFRLQAPVTISTENSQDAFQPVGPEEYQQQAPQQRPYASYPGRPLPPPAPYYSSYPYHAGYYAYPAPYYYGPSFFFYSGPRFYGYRGYRRW